jgi:hypothetical protein
MTGAVDLDLLAALAALAGRGTLDLIGALTVLGWLVRR